MKRIVLLFVLQSTLTVGAQIFDSIPNPTQWTTSISLTKFKMGDEIDLIFSVKIDSGWHLYSTEFPCRDAYIPTEITFLPNKSYALIGKINPVNPKNMYDSMFNCDLKVFEKTAEFRQRIKVLANKLSITGSYLSTMYSTENLYWVNFGGKFDFEKI
jgi:thiol:disulfide interchange protein DsbD